MTYNEIAAKWWTDKMRNVVPENFNTNGRVGPIAKLLASYFPLEHEPSDKCFDLFEKKLADIIKDTVEKHGYMLLLTIYNTDIGLLGNLANDTGIDTIRIPHETAMWIKKEKISVRYGYNAPIEKIFPN